MSADLNDTIMDTRLRSSWFYRLKTGLEEYRELFS